MNLGGSEKNQCFQLDVSISMLWSSSGESWTLAWCCMLPSTCTWSYRNLSISYVHVFPPCKVSNPTFLLLIFVNIIRYLILLAFQLRRRSVVVIFFSTLFLVFNTRLGFKRKQKQDRRACVSCWTLSLDQNDFLQDQDQNEKWRHIFTDTPM